MIADNLIDLQNDVMSRLDDVVNYVVEKATQNLKDSIDTNVYGVGIPSVYDRTYEFRESWVNETKSEGLEVEGEIHQDVSIMSYDPANFTHGSLYSDDIRDELAMIIFGGLSGDLFGTSGFWMQPRDAWSPWIDSLNAGEMDALIMEGLRLNGFEVRKGGYWKYWSGSPKGF